MGRRTVVGDGLTDPGIAGEVEAEPPTPPIPPIAPCEDDGVTVCTEVTMPVEETVITVLETGAPEK